MSTAGPWVGAAWLSAGFGAFQGATGDNDFHAHYAHQLVLAADAGAAAEFAGGVLHGNGIAIPAGTPHRVGAGHALLLYIDPLTAEGRALFPLASAALPRLLDTAACDRMLATAGGGAPRPELRRMLGLPCPSAPDARMEALVATLRRDPGGGADTGRAQLAALAGLSPSRFSHWFVEQTGLPLRSYRKWLRLELALHRLAHGGNLTDAAHAAGFSDSAHLSRTFRTMFGLNPAALLRAVTLDSSFVQAS